MDRLSDEASSSCDSAPSPPNAGHSPHLKEKRRLDAVSLLHSALSARGTVLGAAKIEWLAAEFELEIYGACNRSEGEYSRLLSSKLRELGWTAPLPQVAADQVSVSEEAWLLLQQLRQRYQRALQACFVALVSALKDASRTDAGALKALKRLVLKLVLFLAVPQKEKVPAKFTAQKLLKLESEILHILGFLESKAKKGLVPMGEIATSEVEAALGSSNNSSGCPTFGPASLLAQSAMNRELCCGQSGASAESSSSGGEMSGTAPGLEHLDKRPLEAATAAVNSASKKRRGGAANEQCMPELLPDRVQDLSA